MMPSVETAAQTFELPVPAEILSSGERTVFAAHALALEVRVMKVLREKFRASPLPSDVGRLFEAMMSIVGRIQREPKAITLPTTLSITVPATMNQDQAVQLFEDFLVFSTKLSAAVEFKTNERDPLH